MMFFSPGTAMLLTIALFVFTIFVLWILDHVVYSSFWNRIVYIIYFILLSLLMINLFANPQNSFGYVVAAVIIFGLGLIPACVTCIGKNSYDSVRESTIRLLTFTAPFILSQYVIFLG